MFGALEIKDESEVDNPTEFKNEISDDAIYEFEKLAKASEGVERIAVFRADVDDLGHTFVNGFGGHGGH